MKDFDMRPGQPIILALSGTGFDALQVTISGRAGAASTLLINQRVRAAGAKHVEYVHEFAAGQLDAFEQLQVDPVVYGRTGKSYEVTLTLRHRTGDPATFTRVAKGKLVPSRGSSDTASSGFDAPLFLVTLQDEQPDTAEMPTAPAFEVTAAFPVSSAEPEAELGEPEAELAEPEAEVMEAAEAEINIDDDFDSASTAGVGVGEGGLGSIGTMGRGAGTGSGLGYAGGAGMLRGARDEPEEEPAKMTAELSAVPPSDDDAKHFPVWFGTNRKPVIKDGNVVDYSPYRDEDAVHYGRCLVKVPKSHKIGSTGSSLIKRLIHRTDDRLKVEAVTEIIQKLFWESVAKQVAGVAPDKRDAVVFIHGYNVSFMDAAIRAAQLGCDLSIDGLMAFYSWPSRGTLEGYPADEATVQASSLPITDFLTKVAVKSKAKRVHVIAHSMGNRATLEAVREIVTAAQKKAKRHFSQFILAAPDVDAEYFKQFAERYAKVAARTTMYVSDHDRAVAASRFLHGGVARVGLAPPVQIIKGIDTVYAGYVDESFMGHGYVAEAWQLLSDIHQLIHFDAPPEKRQWIEKSKQGNYWELTGRA